MAISQHRRAISTVRPWPPAASNVNSKRVTNILLAAAAREPASDSLLSGVCQVAVERLRCVAVTVAVVGPDSVPDVVATSGVLDATLDPLLTDLDDGPTALAAQTSEPVSAADLAVEYDTWPVFVDGAIERQVGAIVAFPIATRGASLATMTLYRAFTGPLNSAEGAEAEALTDAVTQVLLFRELVEPGSGPNGQLRSRRWIQVQQAVGMVSVQIGVSPADALATLRAHAYATEQPLAQLARSVVERTFRFKPSEFGPAIGELPDESEG